MPVGFKDGGIYILNIMNAVASQKSFELAVGHSLFFEIFFDDESFVNNDRGGAFKNYAHLPASKSKLRNGPTQENENDRQNKSPGQRVVASVHGVLNGVTDK